MTTQRTKTPFEFKWNPGKGHSVDPQIVGEKILELERRDGKCTAEALVNEAAPASSPLHDLFEWDDTEAAKQWRVEQARYVIRNIRFIVRREERPATQHIAFVSIRNGKEGGYANTVRVVSDEHLRQQMVDDALTALEAWRERYGHLTELSSVVSAINAQLSKRARKAG